MPDGQNATERGGMLMQMANNEIMQNTSQFGADY